MASTSAKGGKSAGLQRLVLLGFAALLILLFAIFAIAQGIGHPSVPSDSVAVVEDAPSGLGTVTKVEFQHALVQAAAEKKVTPIPKPGDDKYEELKEAAMSQLLESIWIQGEAEEMGISATEKEVAEELKKLKAKTFKTEQLYKEFLKEAKFTEADVNTRVKLQMFTERIQAQIIEEAPIPGNREIENYYEAAKSTQYTTPESRDVRVIKNKDKAKVEAAKAALEKDDSEKSWEKVAKKYSTDTTKGNGGLQSGVAEGTLPEPLGAEVFSAEVGELEGPLTEGKNYVVFEVMKVTPEKVQSLDETRTQISNQLAEQAKQQAFSAFTRHWGSKWRSRTFCASDFAVPRCANYKASSRPIGAEEACYEADPKKPAEACPAPVPQLKPMEPGSNNPLTPQGELTAIEARPAQQPRPAGPEEAAAPTGEIPGGVVPGVPGE